MTLSVCRPRTFAIKNHIHPAIITQQNIKNFTRQLKMLGYGFDWDRCVDTTDPKYYKWTQWIFLQMFKKGLAYKTTMPVNWCTSCKCVLANERGRRGRVRALRLSRRAQGKRASGCSALPSTPTGS